MRFRRKTGRGFMSARGKIDVYGRSRDGRNRTANEDQFLIAQLNKSMLVEQTSLQLDDRTRLYGSTEGHLLLVADGTGRHTAGEDASAIAVNAVTQYVLDTMGWFFRLDTDHPNDLADELKACLEKAESTIRQLSDGSAERAGMATTLTMAYLLWPRAYVVHAGNSRCYLLRQDRLEQVTTDHTFGQALVDDGTITPQEARERRFTEVLWNMVGGRGEKLASDVYRVNLEFDDRLLLCTDGVTASLSDDALARSLRGHDTAEAAANDLIEAVDRAGGRDDATVVVACFRAAEEDVGLKQPEWGEARADRGEEDAARKRPDPGEARADHGAADRVA